MFVNAGKAIAAYERSLRAEPNALDRYVDGDVDALSPQEKSGLSAFFVSGCAQCHWGPTMSDHAFHNLRFATGQANGQADLGQNQGVPKLLASPFSKAGIYSDEPVSRSVFEALALAPNEHVGAFKTPSLRGVADTAPYGHGGVLPDLESVIRHYGRRGLPPADPRAVGTAEPWAPLFDDLESSRSDLAAFLRRLTAKPIP